VEYTLSLPCPWGLDGQRAGQPVLDTRQGQDFSLHNVRTSSGAKRTSYPVSTGGGGFFLGGLKPLQIIIIFM
jgi:hypothetical protein